MSELSPRVRAIVEAGRSVDDPTGEDRARVRGAVLRAIGAGAAPVALGAASAKAAAPKGAAGLSGAGGGGLAVKIGGALSVVILAGAGLIAALTGRGEEPNRAVDTLSAITLDAPAPELPTQQIALEATAEEAPALPDAEPRAPSPDDHRRASVKSDRPAVSEEARAGSQQKSEARAEVGAPLEASTLEEETKRLREAHRAMRSGDPERALALLEEQSAAFASGVLREERAAARVLALCKAGKTSEAKAAAQAFLQKSPRSPLAGKVRGACAGKESSPAE